MAIETAKGLRRVAKIVRDGPMISIGDNLRIERGPAKLNGIADADTLSDAVTAAHYHAPIDLGGGEIKRAVDAEGRPIVPDEPFSYIDWVGFQGEGQQAVFYLYQHLPCNEAELEIRTPRDSQGNPTGEPFDTMIWREIGVYPTEDGAISAAMELAYVVS